MTDDPLDLRSLDPRAESLRFEAAIGRLMIAAKPELRARLMRRRPLDEIGRWWRPMLAAAATIAAVALGDMVLHTAADGTSTSTTSGGWATVAGVPTQLASYVESDKLPGGEQLLEVAGGIR